MNWWTSELLDAAENGDAKGVATLIRKGANVHAKGDVALYCAVVSGSTDTVDRLLEVPTYTVKALRAVLDDLAFDLAKENEGLRRVEARHQALVADDLAQRTAATPLPASVEGSGGLGL